MDLAISFTFSVHDDSQPNGFKKQIFQSYKNYFYLGKIYIKK